MQYTIFGQFTFPFFYYVIVGILSIVIGLTIINIIANMNLISENLQSTAIKKKYQFKKPAFILIGSVVGSFIVLFIILHFLNAYNTQKTVRNLQRDIKNAVSEHKVLIEETITYIEEKKNIDNATKNLLLLKSMIPGIKDIFFLFPENIHNRKIFFRLSPWFDSHRPKNNIKTSENIYIPHNWNEANYLKEFLLHNKKLTEKVFIQRPYIYIYKPIYKKDQLRTILYLSHDIIGGRFMGKY